ncbi:uncharacterized protein LOC117171612 [Belonocnema kinseyi]|uniref:uncharacterized protein LOC117171612 n=1 Tax=Belonocnema kinseyi TaxID=2817044 RepID=UPI00143E0BD5|nr:uncharacterized protein LOC117171612 [Belonocnema kinseyi]XP_033214964.1 uncharacterized protein LOC117171612 [Belonocnema kinseyi]XP_033214965.1 uncharacterized protein LOC117171612 [Belonocnema kinseyi]
MTSFYKVEKLEEALQLFLLPNYNIVSTTYLDLLLTQIADDKTELRQNHRQLFQAWVPKALDTWSSNQIPCQAVTSFTIKLVGLIAQEDLAFVQWEGKDVFNKLCAIFCLREKDLPASVKMAYTSMLCHIIKHPAGRQWIKESGIWRDVISFAHINHTLYVTRESQKFIWTLLLYESGDTKFCTDIILAAVAPLTQTSCNAQSHLALEENYMNENALLCTTLDLVTCILENTLFESFNNPIPALIEELIGLEARVKAIFEACISTRVLQHILELRLLTIFTRLKDGIKDPLQPVSKETSEDFRRNLCHGILLLLSKEYILDIVKSKKYTMIYWKRLNSLCNVNLGLPYKFEHQIICLMLMPLSSTFGAQNSKLDFFDTYVNKMFEVTCLNVQRISFNIREVILKSKHLPMEQIAKSTVQLLLEIIDYLDRDVAIIVFQTMCYVLENYTMESRSDKNAKSRERVHKPYQILLEGNPIIEKPILLSALLGGLTALIEKFKLKWQECVETICILSLANGILDYSGVEATICVKALRLFKLCIQNFMPPNLALLVDSDFHMNEIGPTLFKAIHNPNWEVVDSVLEVLNTISAISEIKYPAFQNFLIKHEFLKIAFSIAMSDGESYVRASALTLIATSVRIDKLWNNVLSKLDFPDKAINLINCESEGIVRRESVALLTELFIHRQWQKSTLDVMSKTMTVAAVSDLHWEVKVNALKYWRHLISSHLSDQGMLDGSFPKVTFSTEHKKIVQLDGTEIKRRINKALDDLGKQNCLGVLLVTLKDESDFAVCKASANILNKLKELIIRYKVNEPFPKVILPKDSAVIDTMYVRPPNVVSADSGETSANSSNLIEDIASTDCTNLLSSICENSMKFVSEKDSAIIDTNFSTTSEEISPNSSKVIEDIVSNNDTNLLSAIYENSMKMTDSDDIKKVQERLKNLSGVRRQDFLKVVLEMDINAYIEERNKWLTTYTNSFESVLDDILMLYQREDVNPMDCY